MKSSVLWGLMFIALVFYGQVTNRNEKVTASNSKNVANYDYEVTLRKGGKNYYNGCEFLTDSVTVFIRENAIGQCHYDTLKVTQIENITILKPQWK